MQANPSAPAPTIVVFDIGNVLISWDPRNLYRKIFSGDEERVGWFLDNICTAAWNLEQDRGRPWPAAVAELSARHPDWTAEIVAYDTRWHEMIPGAIEGTVSILENLRASGVPTYAITNFSAGKFALARQRFPFLAAFDGIVVSGEERLLKPDPAIYTLFLDRYGLAAADCVFVDDSAANIASARAIGFHTHHFTRADGFADDLRQRGFEV